MILLIKKQNNVNKKYSLNIIFSSEETGDRRLPLQPKNAIAFGVKNQFRMRS